MTTSEAMAERVDRVYDEVARITMDRRFNAQEALALALMMLVRCSRGLGMTRAQVVQLVDEAICKAGFR